MVLLGVFLCSGCTSHKDKNIQYEVTYADLVKRLTDVRALAILPQPGESSALFSSYDRASGYDSQTGRYTNWAANDDGPHAIREDGDNEVLAEMEGPGSIVRIWTALPKEGHVKIYIDGEVKPVVDLPFTEYFDNTPDIFDFPALVYTAAKGKNNYIPISYQKSCRVEAEPGWGKYYHINYISFPKGTTVEPFNQKPDNEAQEALRITNDFLTHQLGAYPVQADSSDQVIQKSVILQQGKATTIADIEGAWAIKSFKIKTHFNSREEEEQALRALALRITWDHEEAPAVWCPLGDFFGSAPGINAYKTILAGMSEKECYSYWYMPFAQNAKINIVNDDTVAYTLDFEITYGALEKPIEQLGRFHAKWHRDLQENSLDSLRWPDWPVLHTKGKGRFVGIMLNVWNPKGGQCSTYSRPGEYWWGEGDEKFFVDGEKFPSTFGTGTEDYFGYAWCSPEYFERAFHSQSMTSLNMGYQTLNRWQIIDNVPFQESFDAYLEKYFPNSWPTQYACVAYWYLSAEGTDTLSAVAFADRFGYETPFDLYQVPNALEGELFTITENTGGNTQALTVDENNWHTYSLNQALFWPNIDKFFTDNELTVEAEISETGYYQVNAQFIKTPMGGTYQVMVDDQEIGKPVDLFQAPADTKVISRMEVAGKLMVTLETLQLNAGKHTITFELVDKNEKIPEDESPEMVIDYIQFVPMKTNGSLN